MKNKDCKLKSEGYSVSDYENLVIKFIKQYENVSLDEIKADIEVLEQKIEDYRNDDINEKNADKMLVCGYAGFLTACLGCGIGLTGSSLLEGTKLGVFATTVLLSVGCVAMAGYFKHKNTSLLRAHGRDIIEYEAMNTALLTLEHNSMDSMSPRETYYMQAVWMDEGQDATKER